MDCTLVLMHCTFTLATRAEQRTEHEPLPVDSSSPIKMAAKVPGQICSAMLIALCSCSSKMSEVRVKQASEKRAGIAAAAVQ